MAIFIFLVWKYPLCVNLIQNFKRVILRQNLVPTLECLIDIIDFFPNPNLKQYTYTDFFVQFHVKKPTQNKKTTTYYQLLTLTSFCRSNQIFVDVFTECIAWLYWWTWCILLITCNSKHFSLFVFYFNASNKISSTPPQLLNFQFSNPATPSLPFIWLNGSWFAIHVEALNFHDWVLCYHEPSHDKIKR